MNSIKFSIAFTQRMVSPFFSKIYPKPIGVIAASISAISAVGVLLSNKNKKPLYPSLELLFEIDCFKQIKPKDRSFWDTFLEPNEANPSSLLQHLKTGAPGVIVSTGTERSFFDLLLRYELEPENCAGLIIRDTNQKAIAYTQMVILLLKIARDFEDFSFLSGPSRSGSRQTSQYSPQISIENNPLQPLSVEEVNKKLEIIKARLLHSDLPKKAFAFYLEHLELLCNVYFSTGNEWTLLSGNKASVNYCEKRVANLLKMSEEKGIDPDTINAWVDISECFMGVNYYINETQFRILQDFAKRGKIIALPGDINDLDNIHNRSPIAVLDISNIDQYLPINLNGNLPNFSPKVIWSILPSEINTDFYSYTHSSSCSLSEDEKKEFDRLFKVVAPPMLITEEMTTRNLNAMNWFFKLKEVEKLCNHSTNRPYGYYPEHLATLRAFYDQWIIDHPKRLINLGPKFHGNLITRDASWLHDFDIEELRELAIHPKLQNFSTHLVKAWNTKSFVPVTGWFGYTSYQEKTLDPAKYFAFSDLPNWREEFLKERGRQQNNPEWKKWENENQKLLKTLKL